MKASFELTRKSSVTFSIQDDQFALNGIDVSKDDLTLILELLGFELHPTNNGREFFMEALESFRQLSQDDFEIFDDFMFWNQETKDEYRRIVPLTALKLSLPLN